MSRVLNLLVKSHKLIMDTPLTEESYKNAVKLLDEAKAEYELSRTRTTLEPPIIEDPNVEVQATP